MKVLVKKNHIARWVEVPDSVEETAPLDPAITESSVSNADDRPLAAIDGDIETVVFEQPHRVAVVGVALRPARR
jgi:hypothetical protein